MKNIEEICVIEDMKFGIYSIEFSIKDCFGLLYMGWYSWFCFINLGFDCNSFCYLFYFIVCYFFGLKLENLGIIVFGIG